MHYFAIDVETANEDPASICQIGLAKFEGGEVVEKWETLVNPKAHFSAMNVSIHGILPKHVTSAPTFLDVHAKIIEKVGANTLVSYGAFDRFAVQKALKAVGNDHVFSWLDVTRIVRRHWPECAHSGYGLAKIAKKLKLDLNHHNALSDAVAAGRILAVALSESGHDLDGWQKRINKPLDYTEGVRIGSVATEGNPDGAFFGECITFTGALNVVRAEAARLASAAGFTVADGVTKKNTYLCVGAQDLTVLAGQEKSAKHRKAEALIEKGHEIRIIEESDFFDLIKS